MQEHAPACGRENELIAFLYNELGDAEKRSFESHLHSCNSCRTQSSEFKSIRSSLVAWRDESLGQSAITVPGTAFVPSQKGSALAALRAFFDLSPLWMKGAVTFAALVFCVLSVLVVFQLRSAPATITPVANNRQYSSQELNALVEARVKDELARRKVVDQPVPVSAQAAAVVNEKTIRTASNGIGNDIAVAKNARNAAGRRPLSRAEREELATDLRLLSSVNERSLDLIGDQNQ